MKYFLLGLALTLALVVVYVALHRLGFGRNKESKLYFRDLVMDPKHMQATDDYYEKLDNLRVPGDISDAEIQRMVDRLFIEEDDDFNYPRLELVGLKAVPFLIRALNDPKTLSARFEKGDRYSRAKSPFERICKLLDPHGPPEAAAALAKYVEHDDAHFRVDAALAMGNLGTTECIAPMLKALNDDDQQVRNFAVMGILRGISAMRASDEFLKAMFPALAGQLNRKNYSIGGNLPSLVLKIDTSRALPLIFAPETFTARNSEIGDILTALNQSGNKVPLSLLLPLLESIRPLVNNNAHDYHYSEALKAYALNPDDKTEALLLVETQSKSERVQQGAAEALELLVGVTDPHQFVIQREEKVGFDGLTPAQKHYTSAIMYNAEVNNGGHLQYFYNSSSAHWKQAIEGLKAIGAPQRARILERAVAHFGQSGPSEDRDTRQKQLQRFSSQQEDALGDLDDEFYDCKENTYALLSLYVVKHKEHFLPGRAPAPMPPGR